MANVKIEHTRAVGYCRKGVKEFLERYGISWQEFLANGIPEELLLATDNAMATKAVEYMRTQNGQQ